MLDVVKRVGAAVRQVLSELLERLLLDLRVARMVVVDVIGDGCNGLKKGNLSCIIFPQTYTLGATCARPHEFLPK